MPKSSRIVFLGFSGGLGAKAHVPGSGSYAIGTNCQTRFGGMLNGLKEVVDPTGIAAGFRIIKQIKHNDVDVRITWDGTDSRIYRLEAAVWALKETVVAARCRDVVSFNDGTNSILAWCFGADVVFRYSTNNGTSWTASTLGGTADNPRYFLSQQNNLNGPRVLWVSDPNDLFFATSLVNGTTIITSSEIGDGGSDENFTSLTQDLMGVVLCGKRHTWYAYDNGPVVVVAGPYPDPPADAGGQSDRDNFENPQMMTNGWIVTTVQGYDLIAYRSGELQTQLAPRWTPRLNGWVLPRLELPINAVQVVGDNLVVALGSGNTGTNRSVVSAPGGAQLLQNTFVATSELYSGVMVGDSLVWHGSELTCASLLRGMYWDENDGYLYLFSGASEAINVQARRCYYFLSAPEVTLVSANLQLNSTDVAILETGVIGAEDPFDLQLWEYLKCLTTGLASTVPSLRIDYRLAPEHDTTSAYVTLETYTSGARALTGTAFPRSRSGTVGRLQFRLSGDAPSTPDRFGVLRSAELVVSSFAERRLPLGAL